MNMDRRHPLENVVVLDNLLSYIEPSELSTFRLVCKTWFTSTFRLWRVKKTIVVHPFGDNNMVQAMKFNKFQDFFRFSKYPYLRLELNGKKKVFNQSPAQAPVETFWFCVGQTLTHLTLKDIVISNDDEISYFVDVILFKTPNLTDLVFHHNSWNEKSLSRCPHWGSEPSQRKLKRLTVIGNNQPERSESLQMYLPWEHFLRHFSNLESLEIKHVSCRGSQCFKYFEELVIGLESWEVGKESCPLKTLKLALAKPGSIKTDLKQLIMTPEGVIAYRRVENSRFERICNLRLQNLTTFTMDLATDLDTTNRIRNQLVERFPFVHIEY